MFYLNGIIQKFNMVQYVIKISDNSDSQILTQIINPKDFEFTKTINKVYSGKFFLPYEDLNVTTEILKQFNRFDVYEQVDNQETKFAEGIIRDYSGGPEGIQITLSSFEFLLSRRILFDSGYSLGTPRPVEEILQTNLDTINAIYNTGITLDTNDIPIVNTKKNYKRGEDYFRIIKDLAIVANAEFTIKNRKLEFKLGIGTDRTIIGSPDFKEFRFDINNPSENNILDFNVVTDSKELATAVLGKKDSNYSGQSDGTSENNFGRIDLFESFDSTDSSSLSDQTLAFLNLRKESNFFHTIKPSTKGLLFSQLDIGDIVPVFINTGSGLVQVDGNFKIVKIKYALSDNSPILEIELSKEKIENSNVFDQINNLNSRIKQLEIK